MRTCFKLTFVFLIITANVFSQQYVAAVKDTKSTKWGYINEKGEFIIPPIYNYAYPFSKSGLAGIYDSFNDQVYYINLKGDTILKSNDKYTLINPEGGMLFLHPVWENSLVVESKGKKGIIDSNGEIIIEAKYDTLSSFVGGIAIAKNSNKHYFIERDGNEIEILVKDIKLIRSFCNGRALFKTEEDKIGFLDKDGNVAIEPTFYAGSSFSNNLASVSNSLGFSGFIDTAGNWTIKPNYRRVYSFEENGNWTIARNSANDYIILYKNGETKLLENRSPHLNVSDNLVVASTEFSSKEIRKDKDKKRNDIGYVNEDGEWAIYPQFVSAHPFFNGYAVARKNKFWGFIDKYGTWAVKPQFAAVYNMVKVESEANVKATVNSISPITIQDIIRYFDILKGLNQRLKENKSEEVKVYLDLFFEQDVKFCNWLMGFNSDTLNYGLSQRSKEIISEIVIPDRSIELNDSEMARYLLLYFLEKERISKSSISFDFIGGFLDENQNLSMDELRAKWKMSLGSN